MEALAQNVRYGLRQMRRSPGFALLAIATLAITLAANSAMFAASEAVLIKSLPYVDADRLVYIGPADADGLENTSWLNYRDIQDKCASLEYLAAYALDLGVLERNTSTMSVSFIEITPNAFEMFGVHPILGRTFSQTEGQPGGPQVVLLSAGIWKSDFDADQGILGQVVRLNGIPRTVVGVMPDTFRFPEGGDESQKKIWTPLQPTAQMLNNRGFGVLTLVGRIRAHSQLQELRSQLSAAGSQIRQLNPEFQRTAFRADLYEELLTRRLRPIFIAFTLALLFLLIIGCANVANMLIAKCMSRQHEFGIRAALGALPGRLMSQMFIEGGLLSLIACLLGLFLASLSVIALRKLPSDLVLHAGDITLHWTVLLGCTCLAAFTTILCAVLPAALVSRTEPGSALNSSRAVGSKHVRSLTASILATVEIALSVILLSATGLMFRTLWNLQHSNLGFDATHVTMFTAMPSDASGFSNMSVGGSGTIGNLTSIASRTYIPLLEELKHLPGVVDAAIDTAPPLSGIDIRADFEVVGRPQDRDHVYQSRITAISAGYHNVMLAPLIKGRMITNADSENSRYVAVINEALARRFFPDTDPIGQELDMGGAATGMNQPYMIVGILRDEVDNKVSESVTPLIFISSSQVPAKSVYYPALLHTVVFFLVRTQNETSITQPVRALFRASVPSIAVDNFESMEETLARSYLGERLGLYLSSAFTLIAVVLVIAGLYGVLSQTLGNREREFSLQIALGATRGRLFVSVFKDATVIAGVGLFFGVVMAFLCTRLVSGYLYKVGSFDVITYLLVISLIALITFLAGFVPAIRASRADPMMILRSE